jgi:hypothetical protein
MLEVIGFIRKCTVHWITPHISILLGIFDVARASRCREFMMGQGLDVEAIDELGPPENPWPVPRT